MSLTDGDRYTALINFDGALLAELRICCDETMRDPENLIMWLVHVGAVQVMANHQVQAAHTVILPFNIGNPEP